MKKEAEEAKIGIRNVRRDANDDLKKFEKKVKLLKMIYADYTEEIQKLTDYQIVKIDQVAKEKEKEILEV